MNKQSGFTIVESIVAMIVGAILIGSAILLITSGGRLSQRHRDLVVANAFAERQIEALRSIGFLGLSDGSTDLTDQVPTELQEPRSATQDISTPSAGLKTIDLSLTYNDQGVNRTYSYRTYIGELGVGQY